MIFEQAYPAYSKGDTLTVFDLLSIGDSVLLQAENNLLKGRFSQLSGDIYYGFNNYLEAIEYYEKSIKYLKKDSLGIDKGRNVLFSTYSKLASLYISQGNIDTAYYYMKASEKYGNTNELREAFRPMLYGSLAWMEVNRGNNELADSLYSKSIEIYEFENDSSLEYANQLAFYGRFLNYWDTPGREEQIDLLYEKAQLVFANRGYDTTRQNDFARLINYQGLFHLDLQEFDEAEAYFSDAFEINNRLFGMKNLATLDNLNNLALIMKKQGRYIEAQEKFRRCWNAAKEINIPARSSLVYYHNYASTFNLLEEFKEAEKKYDSLVAAWESLNVSILPRLNLSKIELSRSYIGLKQYDKGERILKDVIKTHQEANENKGVNDIQAGIELVKLYQQMGQKEEAMAQYRENLAAIKS
ncbi:MAG: tetratricopeptide repeat protein, partial [Bacteroidota bacterium]